MKPVDSIQLYKRLLGYLKGVRKHVIIALATMLIAALTEPLLPALMQPLVDSSLIAKDSASITFIPLAMLALFVVRGVTDYFNRISTESMAQLCIEQIRNELNEKINYLPLSKFDQTTSGEMISKFTFDINQMANALSNSWVVLIRDSLVVIALISYLLYLSWQLSLTLIVIAPIAGFIINKASTAMRKHSAKAQSVMGQMTHVLEENLEGHKEIKMFGAQQQEAQRFAKVNSEVKTELLKIIRITALNVPLVQVIAAASVSLVLYLAFEMNNQNLLTPGTFVAYITAMALLFEPIRRLTHVNPEIQKGLAAAQSIFALLDEPNEKNIGTDSAANVHGAIEFKQVSFRYPNAETYALKDLSLTIQKGETVALVGPSGSGKSTFIQLLSRFYELEQGTIYIDGCDIQRYDLYSLREKIAMVSQQVILLNASVRDNIAYGINRHKTLEEIVTAATNAHANEFIESFPEKYDSNIGENGSRLSGGQRQRLALARAFLKDAPILLLDEASSALDNTSEKLVQQAIQKITHNRTTIIVAHRLSTIEMADRIIVLNQGQIEEIGTHAELINSKGLYASLAVVNQS